MSYLLNKLLEEEKKIKLLIDGDILVYRMGFACQTRNGEVEPFENAAHLVKKLINDLMEKFKTYNIKVYLTSTDRSNFRYEIAKTKIYKGNRDPAVNPNAPGKPVHYDALREYIIHNFNTEVVSGKEADDSLGIHQCQLLTEGEIVPIMVSIDKDLNMIPGFHYNFVSDDLYYVEEEGIGSLEVDKKKKKLSGKGLMWFYAQTLLGDVSDNIPGLKGYGPVKVYKILHDAETEEQLIERVKAEYIDALSEEMDEEAIMERLYEVMDLLWIWQKEDDYKSRQLKNEKKN